MWQTNAVALRAGDEAMLVDSPYFPDELEALPGVLAGAGFEPDALLATHADFDHLLGRLAFPGLALGLGEPSVERLHREPGAAQRELRRHDEQWYVARPAPLALGQVQTLPVPVIVSGGMREAEHIRWALEYTGAEAIMLARGALGNPWLFEQVLGTRAGDPSPDEVLEEWAWVVDRAEEHLGDARAARYLRKFHPWYVERLGEAAAIQDSLQRAETLSEQRELIAGLRSAVAF